MVASRLAYWCETCAKAREKNQDLTVPRVFAHEGDPVPRCAAHGKMSIQPNNSYFGKAVP